MVDAAGSGAQSPNVNGAGRLSMASPPKGGLRDAAGFAICALNDNVATDPGAEHDATGQSLEAPHEVGAAAGISARAGVSVSPTNRDLSNPHNQRP